MGVKLRIEYTFSIGAWAAVSGRLPESLPAGFAITPGEDLRCTRDGKTCRILGVEDDLTSHPFAPGKRFVLKLNTRDLVPGDEVELESET